MHARDRLGRLTEGRTLSEATDSTLFQLLGGVAGTIQRQLSLKAQKYTGKTHTTAWGGTFSRVEVKGNRLEAKVWLQLEEDSKGDEARELAAILLGPNAKVGQHKLTPGLWVATVWLEGKPA